MEVITLTENVKIMVVDDEPSVLESFKQILMIKDYQVELFPDGPAAIANLKKEILEYAEKMKTIKHYLKENFEHVRRELAVLKIDLDKLEEID